MTAPESAMQSVGDAAVLALGGVGTVSTGDVDGFRRHGHVTVRGLLDTHEASHLAQRLAEATDSRTPRRASSTEGEVYERAFRQYENLWVDDPHARAFTLSSRLADVARRLLGVDRVRIYHDQALFKMAGGGPTPWHQDKHYWPLDTDRAVTMWMPLVDVTADMGELCFARGSHLDGNLSDQPISSSSDQFFRDLLAGSSYEIGRTGAMRAGDASFHAAWTLHSATANVTQTRRDVMTVIWFADGARVTEPCNEGQRADLATWLPGLTPGDLAASALNPVVDRPT